MRPDFNDIVIQGLRDEIERFRALPPEEARREAREDLQSIGVLDEDGNITERYQGVFVRVQ